MVMDKIKEILAEKMDIDPARISDETTFAELGLDSLDTVELVMAFEEEFEVSLEMNEEIKTVSDIAELIENSK
jgi:acyl carrier protein